MFFSVLKDIAKRDFLDGPVVKNLPYNSGHLGSTPGQVTKIPHATGQLSLRATTAEPMHPVHHN